MEALKVEIVAFHVNGMKCSGCSEKVEHGLKALPGIFAVRANHAADEVIVEYEVNKNKRELISSAIQSIGYQVEGYEVRDQLVD